MLEMPVGHKLSFLSSPSNVSKPLFFFFFFNIFINIYSFGCIGPLLWPTGSLLLHVAPSLPWTDSVVGAHGLSCSMAPRDFRSATRY